jgi:hypothetical protein
MTHSSTAALAPVCDPSVWTGQSFDQDTSWIKTLTDEQANALSSAAAQWEGRDYRSLSTPEAQQRLAALAPLVHEARSDLASRGFALLRGVPVEKMSPEQIKLAYWGIGLLFGQGLTQNAKADFLCPVTDMGVDFGYTGSASQKNVRGYQSKADLNYHCDPTDVVALLCVRKAMTGGQSSIVSTSAIFNEIVRHHPKHLPVLLRGYIYDRKEEQWAHEESTSGRIPVFVPRGDQVSCRFARSYILDAAMKGVPLTTEEKAALDCFDSIARRDDMPLRMAFEPGDIQLVNNYKVVHGRTAYEDHAAPERRRFLWRLWLNLGDAAPWNQEDEVMRWSFARFGNLGRSTDEWERICAAGAPAQLAAA